MYLKGVINNSGVCKLSEQADQIEKVSFSAIFMLETLEVSRILLNTHTHTHTPPI